LVEEGVDHVPGPVAIRLRLVSLLPVLGLPSRGLSAFNALQNVSFEELVRRRHLAVEFPEGGGEEGQMPEPGHSHEQAAPHRHDGQPLPLQGLLEAEEVLQGRILIKNNFLKNIFVIVKLPTNSMEAVAEQHLIDG
jgi:hypothetical protein